MTTTVSTSNSIALISDVEYGSDEAWNGFLLDHDLTHANVYDALLSGGFFIDRFPLLDGKTGNQDWLNMHQTEHQEIFDALNLAGLPDLSTVDLKDRNQWDNWHQMHQNVHALINATLGI